MNIQTSLKLWTDDYDTDFVVFDHDFFDLALHSEYSIWLSGPPKSGKKHFSFYLSRFREVELVFLDYLSDSQIIHLYDTVKCSNKFAVFIGNNCGDFSLDVVSRLNALFHINFFELNEGDLFDFLNLRLNRVGVVLEPGLIDYCKLHLPCSYFWVDSFVSFLKNERVISLKRIRDFFSKL